MKVAVIGGRDFKDKELLTKVLNMFLNKGDILVSGGAPGADSLAEGYARKFGFDIKVFLPKRIAKRYFLERNIMIANEADVVIAFPTGFSRGTWHTIDTARKLGRRCVVYETLQD